jgi:hypothetical protein
MGGGHEARAGAGVRALSAANSPRRFVLVLDGQIIDASRFVSA